MSIASEITRINTEVSSQTDLMSQIQTALTGKTVSSIGLDAEIATQNELIAQIQAALAARTSGSSN